jgi:1-acyl-sn-glycerol-3-phosphate acyltransferase
MAVSLLARVIATATRARFRISVAGELPAGGCVLISHHNSYWDGLIAAALDPRVTPITSRNWLSIPLVGAFLDAYGVLWTGDHAIAHATALVRRGSVCWLAPRAFDRGKRHPQRHLGAARICMEGGVPALPLSLSGFSAATRGPGARPRVRIEIGRAIAPESGESPAAFTARVEAAASRGR